MRRYKVGSELCFLVRYYHFDGLEEKIRNGIDFFDLCAKVSALILKDRVITVGTVYGVGSFDSFVQRFLAVGGAAGMVPCIPLFTKQRALPKEPVHLLGVFARPECQFAAEGQIRLRLAGETILPVTDPKLRERFAVVRLAGFFEQLLV